MFPEHAWLLILSDQDYLDLYLIHVSHDVADCVAVLIAY